VDAAVRRQRFRDRITTERKLLTLVNAAYGDRTILAGVTEAAIETWRLRVVARGDCDAGQVNSVVNLMLEISERERLLSDNSRDVFDGRVPSDTSTGELTEMLRSLLATSRTQRQRSF
jgi:hypothetical protein